MLTKKVNEDIRIKIFAQDLRRVLYIGQILSECLEDLKMQSITPSWMKSNATNTLNSLRRFKVDCYRSGNTQQVIDEDLAKEQIKDICLLLDAVSDLADVQQITEIINDCKVRDNKKLVS